MKPRNVEEKDETDACETRDLLGYSTYRCRKDAALGSSLRSLARKLESLLRTQSHHVA